MFTWFTLFKRLSLFSSPGRHLGRIKFTAGEKNFTSDTTHFKCNPLWLINMIEISNRIHACLVSNWDASFRPLRDQSPQTGPPNQDLISHKAGKHTEPDESGFDSNPKTNSLKGSEIRPLVDVACISEIEISEWRHSHSHSLPSNLDAARPDAVSDRVLASTVRDSFSHIFFRSLLPCFVWSNKFFFPGWGQKINDFLRIPQTKAC